MTATPYIVAAVILAVAGVMMFNTLVRRRNAVDNAFAGVDAYLMMRYDLIPNLVATVKGYAKHESDVITRVTELRTQAISGAVTNTDARVRLDNNISQGMQKLMAVGEAYPDLKASENFQQLQRALNEVEERVSAARRSFNACVLEFNNAVEIFPLNLMAGAMGFTRRSFFESPDTARQAVKVG